MTAQLKFIAALAIALALSLLANGYAVYRLGYAKADNAATLAKARKDGEIAALRGRADQINRVALAADADSRALWGELNALAERGRARVLVYRTTTPRLPPLPANCGPGAQRVDAVNRLTGAKP